MDVDRTVVVVNVQPAAAQALPAVGIGIGPSLPPPSPIALLYAVNVYELDCGRFYALLYGLLGSMLWLCAGCNAGCYAAL